MMGPRLPEGLGIMRLAAFTGIIATGLLLSAPASPQVTPPEVDLVAKGHALVEDVFAMDSRGTVYLADHWQHTILKLDPSTGDTHLWEGPLPGSLRALIVGPDDRVYWTCRESDAIFVRKGDEPSRELASGLPGVASLALNNEGRLFAAQSDRLDAALYEIDPAGAKPPRKIGPIDPQADAHWAARKEAGDCGMPALSQLGFAPDGRLYGVYDGEVVSVSTETVAMTPTGIRARTFGFGTDGGLYISNAYVNNPARMVERIDLQTNSRLPIYTEHSGSIANLGLDTDGDMIAMILQPGALVLERLLRRDLPSTVVPLHGIPTDVAVYGNELFVAEGDTIRKINLATGATSTFAAQPLLDRATGIDVSERYVHAVSSGVTGVQTFDRRTGAVVAMRPLKFEAFDVLEMDDGSLIVLSFTRYEAVLRLPPLDSGETEAKPLFEDMYSSPSARLARADAEHVYVNEGSMGLLRLNINTGIATTLPCELESVGGMTTLPNGDLLVIEAHRELSGRITRVRPADGTTEIIATLPDDTSVNARLAGFFGNGIAVAPDGTLYIVSATHQAIFKLPTT